MPSDKGYIVYDSMQMTFWEGQNYRDRKPQWLPGARDQRESSRDDKTNGGVIDDCGGIYRNSQNQTQKGDFIGNKLSLSQKEKVCRNSGTSELPRFGSQHVQLKSDKGNTTNQGERNDVISKRCRQKWLFEEAKTVHFASLLIL